MSHSAFVRKPRTNDSQALPGLGSVLVSVVGFVLGSVLGLDFSNKRLPDIVDSGRRVSIIEWVGECGDEKPDHTQP